MSRIDVTNAGRSWLAKISFFMTKRKLGKVVTPVKVHALHTPLLYGMGQMELSQEKATRIPAPIKALAQIRTAMLVGCPF